LTSVLVAGRILPNLAVRGDLFQRPMSVAVGVRAASVSCRPSKATSFFSVCRLRVGVAGADDLAVAPVAVVPDTCTTGPIRTARE
jgi:hypothetical protein